MRCSPGRFLGSVAMLVALPLLGNGNLAWAGYVPCTSLHQTLKPLLPDDSFLGDNWGEESELAGACPQGMAENQQHQGSPSDRTPPPSPPRYSPSQPQQLGEGMAAPGTGSGNGPSSPPVAVFAKREVPQLPLVNYLCADDWVRPPDPPRSGLFRPPRSSSLSARVVGW
jgi:hypothetical protein